MGILDRFKNKAVTITNYKLITQSGSGFFNYDGKLYQSDIVRACIRPKAQAVGKIIGKHIREDPAGLKINPEPYIKFLLEEPNPYMTGQMLHEKMTIQLMLNNNAFAHIQRDENGYPVAIYPIPANSVEAIQDENFNLYLKFQMANGRSYTFKYSDIIHLRRDFNSNDIFGDNPATALTQLMEIVTTTDQGIINAIKNSNVIKWLLKFHTTLKPEDIKKQTKQFVDDFLKIEDATDGSSAGAAATDAKFDAQQVTPNDYVPNASLVDKTIDRIYNFFNTNKNIIQSSFNEDGWISYYEAEIEPVVMQLSGEYTRKIFSRRERGFGNKIVFESTNLSFASMQTKLGLVQFVDRGIMNPNEVREILNLAPIAEGDVYVRRLDTRPTTE
ncbi:phage portal protein, HK97 family [Acetoanaerobium noterae]|uniref:Phage portal protein, HK97 family n=1 Tax=Acetoanaerobium noterae TaxID=745369 RepID=A0A1T5ALN3_9FIRM|nr:phage portal protein [Acetoanaerobium noterae]SKB35922.1 phage portal protein, HK97 family [Acetoanaerobium noterae]